MNGYSPERESLRTKEKRNDSRRSGITGDRRLRISGTGWICAFDQGEWIAIVRLTANQLQDYKQALIDLERTHG